MLRARQLGSPAFHCTEQGSQLDPFDSIGGKRKIVGFQMESTPGIIPCGIVRISGECTPLTRAPREEQGPMVTYFTGTWY